MGSYTMGTKFHFTLNTILVLYGNYGFRDTCIIVVVLHVAQNIMLCGSLWQYAKSLSYSLGINAETFDRNFQIGHDSSKFQEDGTSTNIHVETPRNSETLELCAIIVVTQL
jgi:hypothetical protein